MLHFTPSSWRFEQGTVVTVPPPPGWRESPHYARTFLKTRYFAKIMKKLCLRKLIVWLPIPAGLRSFFVEKKKYSHKKKKGCLCTVRKQRSVKEHRYVILRLWKRVVILLPIPAGLQNFHIENTRRKDGQMQHKIWQSLHFFGSILV